MKNHKGFAAVTALLIVLGIIVIGGAGYVAVNPQILKAPAEEHADDGHTHEESGDESEREKGWIEVESTQMGTAKTSITWKFTPGVEIENTAHTKVTVFINGVAYDGGTHPGSCSEIGASGGVDGKGLLAGQLSAAQCWFAGSGDEVAVFAHEDGGFDLMIGQLSEGEEGAGVFRGNFVIKTTIPL